MELYGFCFGVLKKNRVGSIVKEHSGRADEKIQNSVLKKVLGTTIGKMYEALR